METRKKLPLPAGRPWPGLKKKSAALSALALLALIAGLAARLLLLPGGEITSAKAFLDGSPIEIRTQLDGRIEYIAKAGQAVSAGEVVLRMSTAEYEQAAKSAENVVSLQAGNVPQHSRDLMLRYLAIPQSESELAEQVQKNAELEKNQKKDLDELTERQAVFSIELRRLELKHQRLAEEEARMEAMRVEENLLRGSLREAVKKYETASLERASAEKRLQSKRDLSRALRSLPPDQREQLYALQSEFFKMHEAERRLELASATSPQNGRVMYAVLAAGSTAAENDVALYILPDENPDVWVRAYFSQRDADKMRLGSDCTVTIDGAAPLALHGLVAEKMPDNEQDRAGEIPFKIHFRNLETAQLAGLNPGQAVKVSVKN